MSAALGVCRAIQLAHCSLQLKLDDELGTLHGIAWDQFNLLAALDDAGGSLPLRDLPRPLGLPLSGVVRMLLPLEKVGLVAREADAQGRRVRLCPGGRRVLHEARETAAAICASALADPWPLEGAQAFLRELAGSTALELR